jgi:tetratricopeptide (TPR) repeat protein
MTRLWGASLLSLALVFVPVAGVSAQGTDSASDAEAHARFDEGRAAYEAGRFDDAARAFQRAYLLSPRYALLFNIGQSQLRGGHDAQALAAFEAFLRQAPADDPHHAEVSERVSILRSMGVTATSTEAATGVATATTTTTTDTDTADTATSTDTRTTSTTDASAIATTEPAPPPAGDSGPGIAPWIVLGSGAALVVVGAVLMGVGASDASSVTGAADGTHWSDLMGAANDANTLWGVGLALGIVGLAAVGGGLGWALAGSGSSSSEASARLDVTANGLRVSGAF